MALQRDNWIHAARLTLATQGLEAVRIEVLARQLGVSKGSFYWHFANRADLLEALLQQWEQETGWLIEQSRQAPTPQGRMEQLFALIAQLAESAGVTPSDAAIFLWAQQDPHIAERVRTVERQRMSYLIGLLEEAGQPTDQAQRRATVAYMAFLGYSDYTNRVQADAFGFRDFGDCLIQLIFAKQHP